MHLESEQEIGSAAKAAGCVVQTHQRLSEWLQPGQTLAEIDAFIAGVLTELECTSAFLGYRARPHPPFPSHSCLSPNSCVVHGTHDLTETPISEGDLLSVDIGVTHEGWIGDAAWTYAIRGTDEQGNALMKAGKGALAAGIEAMQPGRPLLDWARAVENHAETTCGFKLIRGLGGHGYGRELHGPPFISNVVPQHPGEWADAFTTFKPGMLVAVEPMLSLTSSEIRSDGRKWPLYTADDSLSVHYEADILITADGPSNLTAGLFELPDVVGN